MKEDNSTQAHSNRYFVYGGNCISFVDGMNSRPTIQDIDDNEFMIYRLKNSTINIHAEDIADVITLLQAVQERNFTIDE